MDRKNLYQQIYSRIALSITHKTLKPGQRVPSIRSLASELKLSRNTVEVAYGMLISDGFLESRGQAGTFVSATSATFKMAKADEQARSYRSDSPITGTQPDNNRQSPPRPYQPGLPALDLFPYKLWSGLTSRQVRLQSKMLDYPDPAGYAPLRESVATYLNISRGVNCSAEQVFITDGYQGSLYLIGRTILSQGDKVWIEDPCYPPGKLLLEQLGAHLIPVKVDENGIRVSEARQQAPDARFALVTPAHQSPLGVSLSPERRFELLAWAKENNAYIIEDDYDSEYCHDGRPQPALFGLLSHANALYLGTFSKVLSPSLRLGYLVVPESLVPLFNASCQQTNSGCPTLMQGVIAEFINGGHFSRHLRKMRMAYTQRRKLVINSLLAELGSLISFNAPATGLHLLAGLPPDMDDQLLAQHALEHNLGVAALSERRIEHDCGKGLLMGFANITSKDQAINLARKLRLALNTP